MAVSRSFTQLSRRLYLRARGLNKNVELAVRRAAIAADSSVVLGTPVDTGRARAGWIATVGSPSGMLPAQGDKEGQTTIAQARTVIESWKLGGAPIFLTNNVVYIQALDEGSSAQAPYGMTAAAIQAAQFQLRNIRLLGGA